MGYDFGPTPFSNATNLAAKVIRLGLRLNAAEQQSQSLRGSAIEDTMQCDVYIYMYMYTIVNVYCDVR